MELNKELIQKIYDNRATEKDFNTFITEYVKSTKGEYPTPEQLSGINMAIARGVFNMDYALTQAAHSLGLVVMKIRDVRNVVIKTTVHGE